jgi:hypothetical protein
MSFTLTRATYGLTRIVPFVLGSLVPYVGIRCVVGMMYYQYTPYHSARHKVNAMNLVDTLCGCGFVIVCCILF